MIPSVMALLALAQMSENMMASGGHINTKDNAHFTGYKSNGSARPSHCRKDCDKTIKKRRAKKKAAKKAQRRNR